MELRNLSLILFSLILLSGCAERCKDPYVRLGSGCCIDTNHDNLCDHGDEVYPEGQTFEVADPEYESLEEASERKQQARRR